MAKHHQTKGHSAAEIIKQAEDIVKNANEVLKLADTFDWNYESAKHEIEVIGLLIQLVRAQPEGTDLHNQEVQMVKHEQTLKVLLDRLSKHPKRLFAKGPPKPDHRATGMHSSPHQGPKR